MKAIFIFLCFMAKASWAVPPEGFEAASLYGKSSGSSLLYVQGVYSNPVWASDYESMQSYLSIATPNKDFFTLGGSATLGNRFSDRASYFGRYDLTFLNQSLSLKFLHIDYRYIQAAKNIYSLDYNGSFKIGQKVQFYFVLGVYYRFTLNRWNAPTWNPLNYNTEDREYYPELQLGMKIMGSGSNYILMDMGNRDPFNSYNADNLAFDFSYNLATSTNFVWRLTSSTRFSSLLAGTADISEQSVTLGFISPL